MFDYKNNKISFIYFIFILKNKVTDMNNSKYNKNKKKKRNST